jgi:hypothetical protein
MNIYCEALIFLWRLDISSVDVDAALSLCTSASVHHWIRFGHIRRMSYVGSGIFS